jgi:hypothetical protein
VFSYLEMKTKLQSIHPGLPIFLDRAVCMKERSQIFFQEFLRRRLGSVPGQTNGVDLVHMFLEFRTMYYRQWRWLAHRICHWQPSYMSRQLNRLGNWAASDKAASAYDSLKTVFQVGELDCCGYRFRHVVEGEALR